MGLQSPMESRKSENTRLQVAPDDGNATNLGREIYDRHLSMSSVAGPRSAAWQALRLEKFGANRLPMLATLSQRWARVAILPARRASAYEWYVARAASPRTLHSILPSATAHETSGAVLSTVPMASSKDSVVSTVAETDTPNPIQTPSISIENPDRKVEWGPAIFQAGSSLRTSQARIGRTQANRDRDTAGIGPGSTAQNEQSPIRGDMPGLSRETRRPQQLQRADSAAHSQRSTQVPQVHPVAQVESVADAVAIPETDHRGIERTPREATRSTSGNAEPALSAEPEQTSGVRFSENPIRANQKPLYLEDDRRAPNIPLNQAPIAGMPLRHVTRVVSKAPLVGASSNNDAGKPALREEIASKSQILRNEVRSADSSGAPKNRGLQEARRDPPQQDAVPALEVAEARDSNRIEAGGNVDDSAISAIRVVTSHNREIRTAEQSHLQRKLKTGPDQKTDVSGVSSEAAAGPSHPLVGSDVASPAVTSAITDSGFALGSRNFPSAPELSGQFESTSTSRLESSAQTKMPTTLLRTAHGVLRTADVPGAGASKGVTDRNADTSNSEVTLFRASDRDTVDEKQANSVPEIPSRELTYLDTVVAEPYEAAAVELPVSTGDSSTPLIIDSSVSTDERTLVAVHTTEATEARAGREPKALAPKTTQLVKLAQRTPVAEIHRFGAAPTIPVQRTVGPNTFAQSRSSSQVAAVMRTHQSSALAVIGETAHVERSIGSGAPTDAIEASVPLPFASAAQANPSSSTVDVGQVADRVYHMLVDRLASERSRRGM